MHSFSFFNPLYSVSGFAVGLLVGLTGTGSGSLMAPLLVLPFGIHPGTAVAPTFFMQRRQRPSASAFMVQAAPWTGGL
jgi:hypothetical protein